MTVRELAEKLKDISPETIVHTGEGCLNSNVPVVWSPAKHADLKKEKDGETILIIWA